MGDNCLCCKHLRLKEKTIPAASQPPFLGLRIWLISKPPAISPPISPLLTHFTPHTGLC
jgi:hypothetical protein